MAKTARLRAIASLASEKLVTIAIFRNRLCRDSARARASAGSWWTRTAFLGRMANSPWGKREGTTNAHPGCNWLVCLVLLLRVASLRNGVEGFRLKLAIALQQDLNLAFGFFQLLSAGGGKLYSFIEELQRLVERNVSFFQFAYDRFQSLKAILKLGQALNSLHILIQEAGDADELMTTKVRLFPGKACGRNGYRLSA